MLETATKFILDLVLKNETIQKFPSEMLDASAKWVRSWFLTDDDPTTAVLQSPDTSAEAKQEAVQKKTEALLQSNPDFRRELDEHLKSAGIRVENSENVLIGNTIHVQNVYAGPVTQVTGGTTIATTGTTVGGNLSAQEREALQERLSLLLDKLKVIQRGLDLAIDPSQIFKYEKDEEEVNKKIAQLKEQLL